MKYLIEWANGHEVVEARTLYNAASLIKTPITKIITGFLVRVKTINKSTGRWGRWGYWDARLFWQALGERHPTAVKKKGMET